MLIKRSAVLVALATHQFRTDCETKWEVVERESQQAILNLERERGKILLQIDPRQCNQVRAQFQQAIDEQKTALARLNAERTHLRATRGEVETVIGEAEVYQTLEPGLHVDAGPLQVILRDGVVVEVRERSASVAPMGLAGVGV